MKKQKRVITRSVLIFFLFFCSVIPAFPQDHSPSEITNLIQAFKKDARGPYKAKHRMTTEDVSFRFNSSFFGLTQTEAGEGRQRTGTNDAFEYRCVDGRPGK